jgi:hypothetical protein
VAALAAMARRLLSPQRVMLCSDETAEQLVSALRGAARHTDPGGIFPTHLMPGGAAETAMEALQTLNLTP